MDPGEVVFEGLTAVGGEAFPDIGRQLDAGGLELRDEVAAAPFADAKPTVCVMASLKDGSSTPLISLKCRCNEKVS